MIEIKLPEEELVETPVLKKEMYAWILGTLRREGDCTAYEVAVHMKNNGYIPMAHRQATQPRLTELRHDGIVEVVGKKLDPHTKKQVSVYHLI